MFVDVCVSALTHSYRIWLQDCRNVILIFSVRESGRFQGMCACTCTCSKFGIEYGMVYTTSSRFQPVVEPVMSTCKT